MASNGQSTGDVLMVSVSGLRGTLGGSLTPATIAAFAGALAQHVRAGFVPSFKGKATGSAALKRAGAAKGAGHAGPGGGARPSVVVARDGRAGSAEVMALAGATLRLHGCDTLELDVATTPTVGLMVDLLGASAGLQITASHNPQHWCGLKPIVREADQARAGSKADQAQASAPDKALAAGLIDRYNALRAAPPGSPAGLAGFDALGVRGRVSGAPQTHAALVTEHLKTLGVLKLIKKRKLSVTLDHVAASGREAMLELGKRLGLVVHELYPPAKFAPGYFPHTPEPIEANLRGLCTATKKHKAALGLAQDPDADRLALVDERGRFIGEEYTLVLCALAAGHLGLLPAGSTLCVNLSTSRMIHDVAEQFGCHVQRTPVGEANVVSAMKQARSPIGGEGNGGVIWPAVTFIRDSLGAAGLVLALIALTGQTISELVKLVPSYTIVKRKIDLTPGTDPARALARVQEAYAAHNPDLRDGVWVGLTQQRAWLHVRASNTEPILRLIAEAPTKAQADAILDDAGRLVAG
jgi:phosphomannomutase